MKHADYKNILKGGSILHVMKKNFKAILFLVILTAFSANVFGGNSTLEIVDPTFNPQIVSNLYGGKLVNAVQALPDGKILAIGTYNSYNRVPTGKLVRLNADGSLDTTFNNQTVISVGNFSTQDRIILQADGKIIVNANSMVTAGQLAKNLLRFNSDGTLDTSFNFTLGNSIRNIAVDSLGRLVLLGIFSTPQVARRIIRINNDGSLDNSFNNTTVTTNAAEWIAAQGNKIIVAGGNYKIFRLNENGSEDASFPVLLTTGFQVNTLIVQPDNKILYLHLGLQRLNADGTADTTFQTADPQGVNIKLGSDGKIVSTVNSNNAPFQRFLSNGAPDPSFGPYTHPAFVSYTIQSHNKIVIGDQSNLNNSTLSPNNFVRLNLDGTLDSTFNPGGIGFQNILPGSISAIEPLPNGKVFLGGKFDLINDITRPKIARLNADSTLDSSFQINTSGTGNYFSLIRDVYQIRAQNDGKIIVSGWFDYFLDGVAKKNLVRLNSDGSIDTAFNLTQSIPDYSMINMAGRNHFVTLNDGKLVIGNSKNAAQEPTGPLKILEDGARDISFISTVNSQSPQIYIDDVALQPDGKILFGGSHRPDSNGYKTFVSRLNPDGSTDKTFSYSEEPGRLKSTLALLPNGKILVGKHDNGTSPGTVKRLNSDGSPDTSFNSLAIPGGIINAVLSLPNEKIFVGGNFTVVVNGQQIKNLLRLDADGNIEPTTYNLNEEVLCLAADSEGRVLIGGSFTVIGANGAGATRSFVARLTDSTEFDFDGDGKADISIYRPSVGEWWYLKSSNGGNAAFQFGNSSDKIVPADYTGDGKTDVAVWRPTTGEWFILRSENSSYYSFPFGIKGDIPAVGDFDGDGKADSAVFRPSDTNWYIRRSSDGGFTIQQFGAAGDVPAVADYDGDGKSDIAIWRASVGEWWIQKSSNQSVEAFQFGNSADKPVQGDYTGDGKADVVIWRPSSGEWFILRSEDYSYYSFPFGTNGDVPSPGDYDGDGRFDATVFRPSDSTWYVQRSTAGTLIQSFGITGDVPVPSGFVP